MCAFSDGSTRWDWRNHFLQMPAIIWSFSDYSTPASFGTSTEVNLVTCSHLQAFVAVLILENFRGCVWKWLMVQHWIHKLCWLVVWNMNFMTFHRLGMSSSQLTFMFFRGVGIPPTRLVFSPFFGAGFSAHQRLPLASAHLCGAIGGGWLADGERNLCSHHF